MKHLKLVLLFSFFNQSFPSSRSSRSNEILNRDRIFSISLLDSEEEDKLNCESARRIEHLTACSARDGGEAATRRSPKNKIIGSILCGTVTRRSARAKFNYASRIYLNTLVQACCWLGSEDHDDAPPPTELLRESPSFSTTLHRSRWILLDPHNLESLLETSLDIFALFFPIDSTLTTRFLHSGERSTILTITDLEP